MESEGLLFWDWELPVRGKKSSKVPPSARLRGPVKKVLSLPHRKEAVDAIRRVGVSERRACVQAGMGLGAYRFQGEGAAEEPEVRVWIRQLAQVRESSADRVGTSGVGTSFTSPFPLGPLRALEPPVGPPASSTLRGKVLTSRRRPENSDWRGRRASCGVRSGAIPGALTKRLAPGNQPPGRHSLHLAFLSRIGCLLAQIRTPGPGESGNQPSV